MGTKMYVILAASFELPSREGKGPLVSLAIDENGDAIVFGSREGAELYAGEVNYDNYKIIELPF